MRENLDSGRELSVALQRQAGVFSPFYVTMVHVGETTGTLEEIFLRLFDHLEFEEFMRDQVKSALRYPIIRDRGDGDRDRRHQPLRDPGVRQGLQGLQGRAAD